VLCLVQDRELLLICFVNNTAPHCSIFSMRMKDLLTDKSNVSDHIYIEIRITKKMLGIIPLELTRSRLLAKTVMITIQVYCIISLPAVFHERERSLILKDK
jgi:hypothetical protein